MNWLTARLGSLSRIRRGASPRPKGDSRYFGGDIPWLKIGDVPKHNRYIYQTAEGVTEAGRERSVFVEKDTLLLSNSASVGHPFITKIGACIHDGWLAIDNLIPQLNQDFLYWFLLFSQKQLIQLAPSGTQRNLNTGIVSSFRIPIPPLSEQHRIVEILDQADALRKMRADADVKAERILPALFIKMFGDPATNPMRWEEKKLSDLNIDFRYGTSVKCDSIIKGLPVLRIPNILGGEINLDVLKYGELSSEETNRLLLQKGDLLFVRTNGNPDYVGRCAVFDLDEPYIFASYLIRARFPIDTVESRFIAAYLQTPSGRQGMLPFIRTTAGQSNISVEGLKNIPIFLPDIELQRNFVNQLDNLYKLRRQREQSKSILESIFQSLLSRAFSGELTAKWREAHMKELLAEMEEQAKALNLTDNKDSQQLSLL